MTTIKGFEDLHCWQTSRELVNLIYEATRLSHFDRDYGLKDQIRRAAVSVMSNIAEGFGAGSDSEFLKFLGYSRRSVCEVQSQSYTARDQGYLDERSFQDIYQKANQAERQINSLIAYLAKSKKRHAVGEEPLPYHIDNIDQA